MTERAGVPRVAILGLSVTLLGAFAVFGWVIYTVVRDDSRASQPCPLCEAVAAEDVDAVRRVLDAGAPVDGRAWRAAVERVQSPIDRGGAPLEIVRALAERGADPNDSWVVTNSGARTSTRTSTRYWASEVIAAESDDVAVIEALINGGLDVKGQPGGEALCAAAAQGHERVVRRLLLAGAPPNHVGEFPRRTPLAEAIQTRHVGTIEALTSAGAREWD